MRKRGVLIQVQLGTGEENKVEKHTQVVTDVVVCRRESGSIPTGVELGRQQVVVHLPRHVQPNRATYTGSVR